MKFKYYKSFILGSILFLGVSLNPSHVEASYEYLSSEADQASMAFLGDQGALALFKYRQQVEKDAFKTTMKLCILYRKAKGLPDVSRHYQHKLTNQDGAEAWIKILKEGAAQPFSAIFGNKAEYLAMTEAEFLSAESWFGSLYTLYLISSWEFIKAANHCLNTVSEEDLKDFSTAILLMDISGTVAGEAALGFGIGKALAGTFRSIKGAWLWTKMKLFPDAYIQKLGRYKISKAKALMIATPFADSFIQNKRKQAAEEEEIRLLFEELIKEGVLE